jgi:hypothetical protein
MRKSDLSLFLEAEMAKSDFGGKRESGFPDESSNKLELLSLTSPALR